MDRARDFRAKLSRLRSRPPYRFPSAAVPVHFRRSAVLLPFILIARLSELLHPESRGIDLVVHRGVRYENTTLTWRGGSAYGLSADLLLEALEWGLGGAPERGALRLDQLRTYLAP